MQISSVARIWKIITGSGVSVVIGKMPVPPLETGAIRKNATNDPSMNTSPWAKLMSSMMP